jgi:hypothetical protein
MSSLDQCQASVVPLSGIYGSPAVPGLRLSVPVRPRTRPLPLATRSTKAHSFLDLDFPPMSGHTRDMVVYVNGDQPLGLGTYCGWQKVVFDGIGIITVGTGLAC